MRLDFNVLWIDNQPQNVESYQQRVDIAVRKEGFRLQTFTALTFEEAQEQLQGDVILDEIDLVLVDYDLGANVAKGDAAVREIRNRVAYKDIILYSSNAALDLKKMVLSEGIEGVFCAHREGLVDTMIGTFEALVKKVLDLDHCRGIVMGVTSDIDQIVHDSLLALAPKLSPEQLETVVTYALRKIDERLVRFQNERDEFAERKSIESLLAAREAFPAINKLGLLKKVLGLYFAQDHVAIRDAIGKYASEIPSRRNVLGHARLVVEGTRRSLRGRTVASITIDDLRDLRKLLIDYRDTFEELATLLGLQLVEVLETLEVIDDDLSDSDEVT